MAVGRLVAMASGRTVRGAGSGVGRELAPGILILQQDHGEVSTSSWSPLWRKKAPCMFDVSRFANASLVRCGSASTLSSSLLTMACPVANFFREDFPSHAQLQIKIQPQLESQIEHQVSGGLGFLSQSAATRRSFELAMQDFSYDSQHLSDFAIFSWKSLGDVDKAEELYQEALDQASCDNTEILASYANFLWQCDE